MVVIDSDILSDYIQSLNKPREEWNEFEKNAVEIIDDLVEQEEEIMIPTPVIAEILEAVDLNKHGMTVQEIQKFALIAELDTRSAIESARIMQRRPKTGMNDSRPRIKIDGLIVAIAICHGASVIYTRNIDDYKKLVPPSVKIQNRPPPGKQIKFDFSN
jgi:predicted nucleic acid-binding protein